MDPAFVTDVQAFFGLVSLVVHKREICTLSQGFELPEVT